MAAKMGRTSLSPRLGFVIGSRSWARHQGLRAKRMKMRAEGLIYPDVFSIPYFLADDFAYVRDGTAVRPDEYDLVIAELNRTVEQLEYLDRLVGAGVPLALIPGPPELLASSLSDPMLRLVRRVIRGSTYVWAYADSVRDFCDGLVGERRALTIPWPFDLDATRRLREEKGAAERGRIQVLLNVPVRFTGIQQNYPFVLKSLMRDALAKLPRQERERFRFSTFAYSRCDGDEFRRSGFDRDWKISLRRKRGYRSFVRFVGACDAVINLTTEQVLGRITFMAGALGRPGIFSDNAELNRALYPTAVAAPLDSDRLRLLINDLVEQLVEGRVEPRYLPVEEELVARGDFAANGARLRAILKAPPMARLEPLDSR